MREYQRELQQIGSIIGRIDTASTDAALVALVAQHLCVRLSGTIENAVRDNIVRVVGGSSHPRANRYISKRLSDFQNPKPQKILDLLEQFDPGWAASVQAFWEPEIKDAIGSIVGQRNVIAHGGTTDVTIVRVRNWYEKTKSFCGYLESIR